MLGIVQVDVQGMADRYAYDSFLGLFLMVCWGVADFANWRHLPRRWLPVAAGLVLAALSLVTWRQVGYWQDDLTLWAHSAAATGNWKAKYMTGVAQDVLGRHEDAFQSWLVAYQLNPSDPFLNQQLGVYEHKHRHYRQALEYYKKTLAQAWTPQQRTDVLTNMATAYRQMGDTASADECQRKVRVPSPPQAVDWQGAWWKQIVPRIKQYLHLGGAAS
jgi:tetratricopeptide (TPR) repeat protein